MTYFRLGRKVPVVPGESREYVVARYLEIEIAISRQLSYLRLIQDKAFLKTMVIIIITIYYYYSLQLNTLGAASAARGRIRLVWFRTKLRSTGRESSAAVALLRRLAVAASRASPRAIQYGLI